MIFELLRLTQKSKTSLFKVYIISCFILFNEVWIIFKFIGKFFLLRLGG